MTDQALLMLVAVIAITNTAAIIVALLDHRDNKRREARMNNFQNRMLLMNRPRVASVKKHIATRSTPMTQEPSERRKHD